MKKRITGFVVAFLVSGYIGLSAYVISAQGIEQLLICADHGGLKIPFSKYICREYLFAFRGSKQDVDTLQQGIGALFVTQGESTTSEREKILKYLVGKGLDVNRAGAGQIPPLHGAVLANSADEVKILLDSGANPTLRDNKFRLTPLGLALKLQSEDKPPSDRDAVIALLRNANADTHPINPPDLSRQATPSR